MSLGIFILIIYIVAVMNMHYRGKVRFPWLRQSITHTNYLAPYNLLMNVCSALPNKAIYSEQDYQKTDIANDVELLRESWEIIRDEAIGLSAQGDIKAAKELNDLGFNSFFRSGWTRFYLKWYDDYMSSALEKCPKTIEVLRQTKTIKAAMFASLPAGAVLKPHRDPYAGSLRYHLGLSTPNHNDCFILVDDQKHSWHDGKDVIFDETYIHEAHNNTQQDRIILFADMHRKMSYSWVDTLNHWVSDKIVRASSSNNEESEKVGFFNQIFANVYKLRTLSRKVKKWNRNVYYIGKYALFFLLLYWVFIA